MRLDARIGGVLVAPRRTLAALAAGEARAGDVTLLLVLRVVCAEVVGLVRAGLLVRDEGLGAGISAVLSTFTAILPDLVAILAGGMLLSALVHKGARGWGRAFDLAAYAWIPYLAVKTMSAIVYTALQVLPSARVEYWSTVVGVAWGLVVWAFAVQAARVPADAPPPSENAS